MQLCGFKSRSGYERRQIKVCRLFSFLQYSIKNTPIFTPFTYYLYSILFTENTLILYKKEYIYNLISQKIKYGYHIDYFRNNLPHYRNSRMFSSGSSGTSSVAYLGILFLHFTDKVQYSGTQLLIWLLIVIITLVLDYFIPMLGSKYSGGSKWGNRGCLIGTIVGLFFLPWGIIAGPFFGAVIGELLGQKRTFSCYKIRVGVFSRIHYWELH